ncbi:MAG TPA: DUF6520 family protein [Sphingobacteriaceae bacterium]
MKRFKFYSGAVAVVMGIALAITGSAFTSAERTTDDPVYGRTPEGDWILVTSQTEQQRECVSSDNVCKAAFSSDPNLPGAEMTELIHDDGVYAPINE